MESGRGKTEVLLGRYELGRLLGKGTFGKVYHARSLQSNRSVAIKVMDKARALKVAGLAEQIKREVTTMRRLAAHPNVVELHEVMATRSRIYFVMEYVRGGELFDRLERGGRLPEAAAHGYFRQLVAAVDYCHSRGVFHRDLKPENLLLDEDGTLKVSDFGLSALSESRTQDGLLHTTCGTPAYVAPEVVGGAGYDGAKSDVWSCGVVLFVLVAGYLPFQGHNVMEMYRKIQHGDFRCPGWFSRKLKKLLYKILDPNPSTRISIHKIKQSTWFRKGPSSSSSDHHQTTHAAAALKQRTCSPHPGENENGRKKAAHHEDVKKKPLTTAVANLNAFEIISLSAGFDLSGLFVGNNECRKEMTTTRFTTSGKPASAVVAKLHDAARALNLRVRKKDNGVVKMESRKEGRNGVVRFDAEVFEIAPLHHLVEVKRTGGDSLEYCRLVEQGIRPALKDIVWAWHGDDQGRDQEY